MKDNSNAEPVAWIEEDCINPPAAGGMWDKPGVGYVVGCSDGTFQVWKAVHAEGGEVTYQRLHAYTCDRTFDEDRWLIGGFAEPVERRYVLTRWDAEWDVWRYAARVAAEVAEIDLTVYDRRPDTGCFHCPCCGKTYRSASPFSSHLLYRCDKDRGAGWHVLTPEFLARNGRKAFPKPVAEQIEANNLADQWEELSASLAERADVLTAAEFAPILDTFKRATAAGVRFDPLVSALVLSLERELSAPAPQERRREAA